MRRLATTLVLATLAVPILAAEAPYEVSFALWNVENLTEGGFLAEQLRKKLKKDAKVLKELDADVIALTEVGSVELGRKLVSSKLRRLEYGHLLLRDAGDPPEIDIVLASRIPFQPVLLEKPAGSLGLAALRLEQDGLGLYVIATHWSPDASPTERLGLAERLLELLRDELPEREGAPVRAILLANLETTPDDPAVQRLVDGGFEDVMSGIEARFRWTHAYTSEQSAAPIQAPHDYVFVSAPLLEGEAMRYVDGSARARRLAFLKGQREIDGQEYEWPVDDFGPQLGYSDHYPVTARIILRPEGGSER